MPDMYELFEREMPITVAVVTEPILQPPIADIVELRADIYTQMQDPNALREQCALLAGTALMYTVRAEVEGGRFAGSEAKRAALFDTASEYVDILDVEIISKAIRSKQMQQILDHDDRPIVIGSYHNLEGTPSFGQLRDLYNAGMALGVDYVKIATTVNTHDDWEELKHFTMKQSEEGGLITVGMGAYGPLSRIVLPDLGSLLVYAPVGEHVVPGQIGLDELNAIHAQILPQ
ncbi:MAG: type I 3-dehydroquinate dehydratase [bacterium]|nr:type I 3-dehydroquinate dehydratase [bacterium]